MTFSSADVQSLLRELARRLSQQGVSGGIRVVGGAAIALMNPDRCATYDIDALLTPSDPILLVARELGNERGLPVDWLNDAVKGYVPPVGMEDWTEIFREGDLSVSVGSAAMLLAMKLRANRGRRDTEDIEYLLSVCGVTSLEEAQDIYERYHAQDVISDSAAARIKAWLQASPGV